MGLHVPGSLYPGVAVVRLRGVLADSGITRLAELLRRRVLAPDPYLLVVDVAELRGWDRCGQRKLGEVAGYLASRGGEMVFTCLGDHLVRTEPTLAGCDAYADLRAVLAAGRATPRPARYPRLRRGKLSGHDRGLLLRHACHRGRPTDPYQIAGARRWVPRVLGSWALDSDARPVGVLVAELAANALAYGFTDTIDVTLRLWQHRDGTRLLTGEVRDTNPAPPVLRAPKAHVLGGWGLLVVATQSDLRGWYPDRDASGKTVWFARRLSPRQGGNMYGSDA